MSETPSILLIAVDEQPLPSLDRIRALGELRIASEVDEIARGLGEAEVVLAWDYRGSHVRDAWPARAAVRWIHAASVGVDTLLFEEVVASEIVVTNTRGVFERPIAEYVLGLMLLFAKDLHTTVALQDEGRWRYRETETLTGQRLVLCGAGAVGREVARVAGHLGMDVVAVGRQGRREQPPFAAVHGADELETVLEQANYLVLTLPLTNETRGLLNADRLARLPYGARMINVGRGAVIDETALLDALRSGRVAAAALDVFAEEPLPPEHPFWAMPQVVISPHMAGDVIGWREAVVDRFLENLERWRSGRPLLHVVDKRRNALSLPVGRL